MKKDQHAKGRRKFLAQSLAVTTSVSLGRHVLAEGRSVGPNDRIRMGFIGLGNRGTQLLQRFMSHPDVEVAALCDVYKP